MFKRSLLPVVCIAAGFSGAARAQDIKYEKYKLPNGMTVILHEDHSLPISIINTWFRVGAKDELPGRSGFAHLFEHLMFMGTKRVPGGDFDKIMETGGGANNASTSLDRTNYFSDGPASLLPTLLWLDADRLEDLGRTMDVDKLNKQRDVVRNEIRQQVENRPYGRAEEYVYRLMYPEGHPYHNAVYGTHQDLEAASAFNVKDFFATYYVPNNASLVVAGDFDPAKIKPLVATLFGTITRGAEVNHKTAPQPRLDHAVHVTMLDKIQLPMLKMVWHSPAGYAEGDAEMDLAGAVLSQGKSSRLYKRLIFDDKTAVDVSAYQDSAGLGSMFHVDVSARPGADLDQINKAVDEELALLVKDGPKPEELDERKAAVELSMLSRLQSLGRVADKLNEYEYVWGEPNSFKRDLDRYRNATPAAVQSWAAKVLNPDARLVMRVLPEEPERGATPRDTHPTDFALSKFDPQPPESFTLKNGIPVMLWRKDELPLISVRMIFHPGSPLATPAKAGQPELAASMLDEGAGNLDALAFGSAIQSLGAAFGAGVDQESASVSLTVLKRNFDKAAALMGDAVRRPRMTQEDFGRVKRIHLENLQQQDEEPTVVAGRVGIRQLFGDDNPYAWPTGGTLKTVPTITLEDVKKEHAALFRPESATILIAGNVTKEEAASVLNKVFGDWTASPENTTMSSADLSAPKPGKLRVFVVDRPEAVQTVIRFIMPAPSYKTEHRPALHLLNTLLGGGFTSRLNQNLREAHGYAYGAGSRFALQPHAGFFVASASVRADVTGASLKEFLGEFERLKAGDISDAEAAKARETLRTDMVQTFSGLNGVLSAACTLVVNGLPFQTIAQDVAAMQTITAADLNRLAPIAVPLDQGVLVLVGDKKLILDQIKDLGLPAPVELTPSGDPVPAHGG